MIQSLSYKLLLVVLQWVWELKVWELKWWDYIIQVTVEDPWTDVRLALLFYITSVFILVSFGLCLVFVLWFSVLSFVSLTLWKLLWLQWKIVKLVLRFLNWRESRYANSLEIIVNSMKKWKTLFCILFVIRRIQISQFLWEIFLLHWV
jgi:hypothetical protein